MSILTRVVEDLLGKYLSDVQDVKIVDIANGHLSLSNLEIRSSALMSLGLPVEVQAGLVGRLDMRIPWAKLSSEPTLLQLDDLLLFVGPKSEAPWDHELEEQLAHEAKMAALDAAHSQSGPAAADSGGGGGIAKKIIGQILANLQVRVRNVVVRYAESGGARCRPFSLSFAFSALTLGNDAAAPAAGGGLGAHGLPALLKTATLQGVAVCACDIPQLPQPPPDNRTYNKKEKQLPSPKLPSPPPSAKASPVKSSPGAPDAAAAGASSSSDAAPLAAAPQPAEMARDRKNSGDDKARDRKNSGDVRRAALRAWLSEEVSEWHERAAADGALVLQPTEATLRLSHALGAPGGSGDGDGGDDGRPTAPQLGAVAGAERVRLALSASQLAHLSALADSLADAPKYELWRRFRPARGVRPTTHPRLWWQHVGRAVLHEVQLLRPRFDWAALLKRRDERKRYVPLYAQRLKAGRMNRKPPKEVAAELATLERSLPISQILLYRHLAAAHDRNKEKNEENWVDELLADAGRLFGQGRDQPLDPLHGLHLSDAQHAVLARLLHESADSVDSGASKGQPADVRMSLELNVGHVELALREADGTAGVTEAIPALRVDASASGLRVSGVSDGGALDVSLELKGWRRAIARRAPPFRTCSRSAAATRTRRRRWWAARAAAGNSSRSAGRRRAPTSLAAASQRSSKARRRPRRRRRRRARRRRSSSRARPRRPPRGGGDLRQRRVVRHRRARAAQRDRARSSD